METIERNLNIIFRRSKPIRVDENEAKHNERLNAAITECESGFVNNKLIMGEKSANIMAETMPIPMENVMAKFMSSDFKSSF